MFYSAIKPGTSTVSCGGTCIRSCACIGAIYTSRCTSPAEETRSEKLAALVVRFTTLFSVPLSSSVSTRHVFARASALATREYDSLNRIGRMIIIPWMRLSQPETSDTSLLFFFFFFSFCSIFDPIGGRDAKFNWTERRRFRYSLDILG